MPKYHITQSLLSAWLWQHEASEDLSEGAHEDFLCTLLREPQIKNTPQMARGIDFEDAVKALLDGDEEAPKRYAQTWHRANDAVENEVACVRAVADIMRGGTYQVVAYKDVVVKGMTFSLMAKCDWVKEGVIYDCKRVDAYDVGKYYEKAQHPVYLSVIEGAKKFVYVVADGNDVYKETYTREDIPQTAEELILNFIEYLESEPNLLAIYKEKWKI